jgi:hypothetical protein
VQGKQAQDVTIRARFDTHRLADRNEHVIDLPVRVTAVGVETMRTVSTRCATRNAQCATRHTPYAIRNTQ